MRNTFYYPVVFHEAEEGGYWLEVPDLDGCFSEGDTLDEAIAMAKDAIGTYLDDIPVNKYPVPSSPSSIDIEKDAFLMMIDFDKMAWDKRYNSKATKKTLSIPAWLNEAAIAKNINFSNVLQNALMRELQLA